MSSCAVALNSAVLSQMNETIKLPKTWCDVCGCMVKWDGHSERCKPKREKGWSEKRVAAWVGDTIHRLDIKLIALNMGLESDALEIFMQQYIVNAAMAVYMRDFHAADVMSSDHTLGTEFESRYVDSFRVEYLERLFPEYSSKILEAWCPPASLTLLDLVTNS